MAGRRWFGELFEVASNQYGFITGRDVAELGGSSQVLVDLARRDHLDRVAHGVYRFRLFPSTVRDELMEATLWARRVGVISHDTALDLWDLCDVNPARIHLTVPTSARLRRRAPAVYQVHERQLGDDDLTVYEGIPVVTPRRAILDGIERHLDGRLLDQAVDAATRRGLLLAAELDEVLAAR